MSESNGFADRHALLGCFKRRYDSHTLPVSGLKVRFQNLQEAEMSAIEQENMRRDENGNLGPDDEKIVTLRPRWFVACLVDGEGNRMFAEGDIPLLAQMDSADSVELFVVIREHCGQARRVERKNLPTTSAPTSG